MKQIRFFISLLIIFSISITPINVFAIKDEDITAPSAVLMDCKTGQVLYEKNANEIRACASITKVMTLLLVMEAIEVGKINMNDSVPASEHAASMGGSDIWLKPGEAMTVDDLIKATVVMSANDAAVVLAEHVTGSEEEFVSQMNEKAEKLGMKNTVFKNCNGLDEDGHVTTAYDVALMSCELIKHNQIFNYTSIWIDYLRDGKTQLVNTNKLLRSYKGITGLKTGTTSKAGSCISATAQRDDLGLVAVVLGSATGKDRFKDAASLLDYGFANYTMLKPDKSQSQISPVKITNGMKSFVDVKVDLNNGLLIPKGKEKNITTEIKIDENLEAPVAKGQKVGNYIYKIDGEEVADYEITTNDFVEEMSFGNVLKFLFGYILRK